VVGVNRSWAVFYAYYCVLLLGIDDNVSEDCHCGLFCSTTGVRSEKITSSHFLSLFTLLRIQKQYVGVCTMPQLRGACCCNSLSFFASVQTFFLLQSYSKPNQPLQKKTNKIKFPKFKKNKIKIESIKRSIRCLIFI